MKYPKKVIALACAAALGCLALTGCSPSAGAQNDSSNTTSSTEESQGFNYDTTIEETVIEDNDTVTITAKSLEFSSNRANLTINVKNNTKQKFSINSNNGYMSANYINNYALSTGWMSEDIGAGKAKDIEIAFDLSEADLLGINEIGLGVSISANYKEIYEKILPIPTSSSGNQVSEGSFEYALTSGLDAMGIEYEKRETTSDLSSMGKAGFVLHKAAVLTNENGDNHLYIEVENTTDKVQTFIIKDKLAINGTDVYDSYIICSDTIAPGKKCLVEVNLDNYVDSTDDKESSVDMGNITEVSFKAAGIDGKENTVMKPTSFTLSF